MNIYVKLNDPLYSKWVFDVFYKKTDVKIGEIHLSPSGWTFDREEVLPDYLLTRPIKNRCIILLCARRKIKPMDLSHSLYKQIRCKALYLYHRFRKEILKEEEIKTANLKDLLIY